MQAPVEEEGSVDEWNKTIKLSSDNFYKTILEISKDPKKYEGWTILLTGEVSRDDRSLPEGVVTVGRVAMTCCIADTSRFGIAAYSDHGKLPMGSWVRVKGTLGTMTSHGQLLPDVHPVAITKAPPVLGFIYP
ncbi:MAG TPA: hypothetical protein OIL83_02930 [Veillonellaceae bacterium]|uniref:TIGR03943 family putative permease subunit n=1 Tax=Dialister hominis TaxID=2582419 RepID=UPI00265D0DA9|nr:hypothetical protein [uncultured Dialister sp.]HJI42239.1 hypothetical protein [Veillonellaceae bacterium]